MNIVIFHAIIFEVEKLNYYKHNRSNTIIIPSTPLR